MPADRPAFAPLEPGQDAVAASLLVAAMPGVSSDGAEGFLNAMRADTRVSLVAAFDGGQALALYVLRKVGVTTELLLVAADPASDPALGLEAAAVRDAGERVGRRPLTVETSERALDWYRGLGFKLVGKRRQPDGSWSYRLGWHGRPEGAAATETAPSAAAEPCPDPAALLGPLAAETGRAGAG